MEKKGKKSGLKELIARWIKLDYIRPEDIPNIELYMDQVTTFMDQQLANTKRHPDDKTLTKTMINNYTKNDLLPPPIRKKYSKQHLFLLIYIYYYKSCLSINDIQKILAPMIDRFCRDTDSTDMENIYNTIFHAEMKQFTGILENVDSMHNLSKSLFEDYSGDDREYLDNFAFLALLSYDIYIKKKLMEHIIDSYSEEQKAQVAEKEARAKEAKKEVKKETRTAPKEKDKAKEKE